MNCQKKRNLVSALLLVGGLVGFWGCSDDSDSSTSPSGDEVFTTVKKGDAKEIVLGFAPKGTFRVEIKGLDAQKFPYDPSLEPMYLMLYDGTYGYNGPTRSSPGLLYLVTQYRYSHPCSGGKIKAWNNGNRFAEECYQMAWDSSHWYQVEVTWGGGMISISIDGQVISSDPSGPIDSQVIAVLGYPSYFTAPKDSGIVGLEYRNWSFSTQ